ncbi:transposase [Streptomyces sp. NPDC050997]|uniref:transposase n=1 Tax=Streptomyces sp. NPDC050997 TaxID=3155519 RepID=UPI00342EA220
MWKSRAGTAWRNVPERYGPWATLHTPFRRWAMDGTFERILRPRPGTGRCGRGHRLTGVGRLHHRPIPPATPRITPDVGATLEDNSLRQNSPARISVTRRPEARRPRLPDLRR